MLVVEQELVLDLAEEEEEKDWRKVLKDAMHTVLNQDIHEFTMVSHLTRKFWVRDLTQILKQTTRLEVLSLFSVALTGSKAEFQDFGQALRRHQGLREVHMVDCGMLGNWQGPRCDDSSVSTKPSIHTKKRENPSADSVSTNSAPSKHSKSSKTTSKTATATTTMGASVGTSTTSTPGEPALDVILEALAAIPTMENLELYGIPSEKFDKSSDGDQESGHQAVPMFGEGDNDIPMIPMGGKDSITFSDDDFLDDYNGDIRGIPGAGREACTITKKLSMMMSPKALGELCKGPNITNLGLEDVNLTLKHIELLAEAFSAPGHKIKELKLYGCSVDDKGSLALARMLNVNKTLEKLDLSYNRICDDGCVAIAAALRGNETLKCLNLMGNKCAETYDLVSEGGCYEALMELLETNKTLKDLILEPFEQDDTSDTIPEFILIPTNKSQECDDMSSASDS